VQNTISSRIAAKPFLEPTPEQVVSTPAAANAVPGVKNRRNAKARQASAVAYQYDMSRVFTM